MGIRGLSSLLSGQESLFKPINLLDIPLVIDGNNISIWLYQNRCSRTVFNGDYNEYALIVKKFFHYLKECKILPIVILDGAHEERKLKKTRQRMQDRIRSNGLIMKIHPPKETPWPALIKEVFKNILDEEKILYIQCLLEADVDIIKTAQLLSCPVLSLDADYYLNDVSYIPLNKFYIPKKFSGQQHVINAQQFDRSKFFDTYGSLPVKFLPLLSFLLGNDYSGNATLELVSAKMDIRWSSLDLEKKIVTLIKWLQTFNSPNDAVNDILTNISDLKLKEQTERELLRCLTEQNSDQKSYLIHSLATKATDDEKSALLSRLSIQAIDKSPEWLDTAVEYIKNKIPDESWSKAPIPKWILKHHIFGELPREVMDIIYSKRFFFTLQIEDHTKESVKARMLEIFQSILGIIYHGYPERDSPSTTIYLREGDHVTEEEIIPLYSSSISCGLTEIPSLPASSRQKIALDVLQLDEFHEIDLQENAIPHDWELFLLTLADWYKDNQEHETATAALGCLLFSAIFVKVIDEKVPNHVDADTILKDFDDVRRNRLGRQSSRAVNGPFSTTISNVDLDDCKVALRLFLDFRNPLQFAKTSPWLDKVILHHFALFQSWTILVEMLNSVLNKPFSSLKIENFFCGTLTYNIYFDIKKHRNLQSFIDVKFKQTPTLQALFRAALKIVEKLSKCRILSRPISHEEIGYHGPQRKRNRRSFEYYEPQGESSRGPYEYYQPQRKRSRWS